MQKAVEQSVSVLGECGLRMKLDADHGMLAMFECHDLAVVGGGRHAERGREGFRRHGQRVVARGMERGGEAGKNPAPIMMDWRHLAVHRLARPGDPGAKRGADRLMSEAHTECGDRGAKSTDYLDRDACLVR